MTRFVHCTAMSVLCVTGLTASAHAAAYNITDDTYLDNFYVSTTSAGGVTTTIDNAHTNYGHGAALKATSNNGSGSDYPGVNSLTHAVFTLPSTFWNALGTGVVTQPVTVTYYARNPSTATNDALKNPNAVQDVRNGTYYRQLEMHPLLQPFMAGTGGSGTDTRTGAVNTTQAPKRCRLVRRHQHVDLGDARRFDRFDVRPVWRPEQRDQAILGHHVRPYFTTEQHRHACRN